MFKLGDIIVDHVQYGFAESFQGEPLYVLSQLSEMTINVSGESTDVTDALGNVVATIWRAKTGGLTATNAFLSLPLIASKSGSDAEIATTTNAIVMPKIDVVEAGSTLTLEGYTTGAAVSVAAVDANYNMSAKSYTLGTTASATEFAIDTSGTNPVLTPPTDAEEIRYIVKYNREVKDGAKITNRSDKMPKAIRLTFKVLILDPCDQTNVQAAYIYLPSFQPSPEMEISLSADSQTLDYSGALHVNYCSVEKELFTIYIAADDTED